MAKSESSSIGIKIPTGALPMLIPLIGGLLLGGGGTGFLDILGAQKFRSDNYEGLQELDGYKKRVIALEAQLAQTLALLTEHICEGN